MAPKLVNAISYFVANCPYVLSTQDLVTKTRIQLDKGYFLDLFYNETLSKYSYTLILSDQRIVGWDNAPHHPGLTSFPHHFHAEDGAIQPSSFIGNPEQDIEQVVKTINAIIAR